MDILRFLQSNRQSARKIFGERELKIIEKQLQGISLTQSEKNRLSRDIRQKLDFIKELARFSASFRLKKGANIKDIIDEAVSLIKDDISFTCIKEIILFGSAAENKLTPRSDIDIAVVFDQINVEEATLFRKRMGGKVSSRVDVQVYNILPQRIKDEINAKGKELYRR